MTNRFQNYWVLGLHPSYNIPETRNHNVLVWLIGFRITGFLDFVHHTIFQKLETTMLWYSNNFQKKEKVNTDCCLDHNCAKHKYGFWMIKIFFSLKIGQSIKHGEIMHSLYWT
jgi:hypothetical protein